MSHGSEGLPVCHAGVATGPTQQEIIGQLRAQSVQHQAAHHLRVIGRHELMGHQPGIGGHHGGGPGQRLVPGHLELDGQIAGVLLDVGVDAVAGPLQELQRAGIHGPHHGLAQPQESPGTQIAVVVDEVGGHFGQASLRCAIHQIHLEQPLGGHNVAGRVKQVVFISGGNGRDRKLIVADGDFRFQAGQSDAARSHRHLSSQQQLRSDPYQARHDDQQKSQPQRDLFHRCSCLIGIKWIPVGRVTTGPEIYLYPAGGTRCHPFIV